MNANNLVDTEIRSECHQPNSVPQVAEHGPNADDRISGTAHVQSTLLRTSAMRCGKQSVAAGRLPQRDFYRRHGGSGAALACLCVVGK